MLSRETRISKSRAANAGTTSMDAARHSPVASTSFKPHVRLATPVLTTYRCPPDLAGFNVRCAPYKQLTATCEKGVDLISWVADRFVSSVVSLLDATTTERDILHHHDRLLTLLTRWQGEFTIYIYPE